MNRAQKTTKGFDLYYNGFIARSVKLGDIILRPIIPNSLIDRLLNFLLPGKFEHGIVYAGDEDVLNIYPDREGNVHLENIFSCFDFYPQLNTAGNITIVRLTDDEKVCNNFLKLLYNMQKKKIVTNNFCTKIIAEQFIRAGLDVNKTRANNSGRFNILTRIIL